MARPVDEILTLDEARASDAAVLNRKTVAAILGVDPRTVTAGIDSGSIPSIKLGRRVLIPRKKFLKLFDIDDDQ